jgi:hypothetical protein
MALKHAEQQPIPDTIHKSIHTKAAPAAADQITTPTRIGVNVQAARASDILALQRQVGNSGVLDLLAKHQVQAKLSVGPADDHYEQEADRVASQVINMPGPGASTAQREAGEEDELQTSRLQREAGDEDELQTSRLQRESGEEDEVQTSRLQRESGEEDELQTSRLQREAGEEDELQAKSVDPRSGFEAGNAVESQLRAQQGSGSPLPTEVRSFMEPRFGADFGGVRLHLGGEAASLNRQINAIAFTHGQDIYMGADKYSPGTDAGKHLLAHELTHVLQQTGGARRAALARKPLKITPVQTITPLQRVGHLPQEYDLRSAVSPGFKWKGRSTYAIILDLVAGYHRLNENNFHGRLEQLAMIKKAILKWEGIHGEAKEPSGIWALLLPKLKRKKVIFDLKKMLADEVGEVTQKLREKRKKDKEAERIAKENERMAKENERLAKEDAKDEQYFKTLPDLDPRAFIDPNLISQEQGEKPKVVSKEEGAGELSKVYKVTHKFGVKTRAGLSKRIPGGKFRGYFKHQLDVDENVTDQGGHRGVPTGIPKQNPRFMERSLAMYEMDKLLGAGVISPTYASFLNGKKGYIQEEVKGRQGSSITKDETYHFFDATTDRYLSKLYLLDIICNQVDRHNGNFFITLDANGDPNGVKGIDNDLAFGEKYTGSIGGKKFKDFPIYLPFAQKIVELAAKPELIQKALYKLLTEGEIAATVNRLQELAKRLKPILEAHKNEEVVDTGDY